MVPASDARKAGANDTLPAQRSCMSTEQTTSETHSGLRLGFKMACAVTVKLCNGSIDRVTVVSRRPGAVSPFPPDVTRNSLVCTPQQQVASHDRCATATRTGEAHPMSPCVRCLARRGHASLHVCFSHTGLRMLVTLTFAGGTSSIFVGSSVPFLKKDPPCFQKVLRELSCEALTLVIEKSGLWLRERSRPRSSCWFKCIPS